MVCQACHRPAVGVVCSTCRRQLRPAPDRIIGDGIRLVAAFEHRGPAKVLIHNLKYRGVAGYADLVAEALADRIPHVPVVPVPRALTRRLRYGVDPTTELARALATRTGAPVMPLLRAPIHTRRRAGGDHGRPVGLFPVRSRPPSGVVVIDDVVTTGATLATAIASLGPGTVAVAAAANLVV